MGSQEEFENDELKDRRASIAALSAAIESDARVAVVSSGAFWAWVAVHTRDVPNLTALSFVLAAPTALGVLLCIKWKLQQAWIDTHAAYVYAVECERFYKQEHRAARSPGWEHFLREDWGGAKHVTKPGTGKIPGFKPFNWIYYGILIAGNAVLGLLVAGALRSGH